MKTRLPSASKKPAQQTKSSESFQPDSPAASGFSLPAEWDPHEATWLAWPHNWSDWPGKFASIPWVFGEIVRKITQGEKVRLLVRDAAHAEQASRVLKRVGVALSLVEIFQIPTDRGW